MKNVLLGVILAVVLGVLAAGGWYYFLKKTPEGDYCRSSSRCETGLNCVNNVCSSGKVGSVCAVKSDCKTGFCVNGKCTEGKVDDACATYKDCNAGLLCQKGACAQKSDYSKYFGKVVLSKMKPGLPPGPNNPLTLATTFKAAVDAIEIDFVDVKPTTVGPYYLEIVNAETGEVGQSTQGKMDLNFSGKDVGFGTDLKDLMPGTYDLNIYFGGNLIYSTSITVE